VGYVVLQTLEQHFFRLIGNRSSDFSRIAFQFSSAIFSSDHAHRILRTSSIGNFGNAPQKFIVDFKLRTGKSQHFQKKPS